MIGRKPRSEALLKQVNDVLVHNLTRPVLGITHRRLGPMLGDPDAAEFKGALKPIVKARWLSVQLDFTYLYTIGTFG